MKKFIIPMVLVTAMLGQTPSAHKQPAPGKPTIDVVIDLVQGGMSESLVIKTLRSQDKTYGLSPADVLRLQKAGVTENIIAVMMDPKVAVVTPAVAASTPAPASPVTAPSDNAMSKGPLPGGDGPTPVAAPTTDAGVATPFPPDLANAPTTRKRRAVVAVFEDGAAKHVTSKDGANISPIQAYWLAALSAQYPSVQSADDVGRGIQALLMNKLQQSNAITLLERNVAIENEQKQGLSAQNDPGTRARLGRILGADCIVTGDITIFGRDDKVKKKGGLAGVIPNWKGIGFGGFGQTEKEEKAVVAITFRIVDSETSVVLLADNTRGESTRKSKSLGIEGLAINSGGAGGGAFQNTMTSSGFEKTILGEATMDAVNKIAKQLEDKIPRLPVKQREVKGRLASIKPNAAYLALGRNDGVEVGDRFEVQQINHVIIDQQTKDEIGVEADKVGELVVTQVEDKMAIANYGGQPLSEAQLKGKGYQARLMSK